MAGWRITQPSRLIMLQYNGRPGAVIHTGRRLPDLLNFWKLGRRAATGEGVRPWGISGGGVRSEPGANQSNQSDLNRHPSGFVTQDLGLRSRNALRNHQHTQRRRRDRANGCSPCIGGGVLNLHNRELPELLPRPYRLPSVLEHFRLRSPPAEQPMR